jgi:parallel beta-helix repeat protein
LVALLTSQRVTFLGGTDRLDTLCDVVEKYHRGHSNESKLSQIAVQTSNPYRNSRPDLYGYIPLKGSNLARFILLVVLLCGTLFTVSSAVVHAKKIEVHMPIVINGDGNFLHSNGVSRGKGTSSSPYIIQNLNINASLAPCAHCGRAAGIEIRNTDSYFIIKNVYIYSGSLAPAGNAGVKFYNVSNGRVETSTFQNDAVGILGDDARDLTLNGNVFTNQEWGIALSSSTRITISGNRISSSSFDGIMIGEVKGGVVDIVNNTVSDSAISGITTFAVSINVSGNVVINNRFFGIYDLSDSATITANNVTSNPDIGIQISSGTAKVDSNLIKGNGFGVLIGSSGITTLWKNQISANSIGVESQLQSGSTGRALVFHNNFVQNSINAMPGVDVAWDAGYPVGGNYWSDYTGVDNCSSPNQNICPAPDGIGDTPYYSMGVLLDHYPLIKPFV